MSSALSHIFTRASSPPYHTSALTLTVPHRHTHTCRHSQAKSSINIPVPSFFFFSFSCSDASKRLHALQNRVCHLVESAGELLATDCYLSSHFSCSPGCLPCGSAFSQQKGTNAHLYNKKGRIRTWTTNKLIRSITHMPLCRFALLIFCF